MKRDAVVMEQLRMEIQKAVSISPTNLTHEEWAAVYHLLVQACVQAYNVAVWDLVFARWKEHIGKSQPNHKEHFYTLAGMDSRVKREGLEIICYTVVQRRLQKLGIQEVHQAQIKPSLVSSTTFPSWDSQKWRGRIEPLFSMEEDEAPPWLKATAYWKRAAEIRSLLANINYRNSEACCQAFDNALREYSSIYMYGILHYSKDKASEILKQGKNKESALVRTKWMFPKMTERYRAYVCKKQQKGESIQGENMVKLANSWVVFTTQDGPAEVERGMVKRPLYQGRKHSLAELLKALEDHQRSRAVEEDEESDDSDWPGQDDIDSQGDFVSNDDETEESEESELGDPEDEEEVF
jgi:hypothetical protein